MPTSAITRMPGGDQGDREDVSEAAHRKYTPNLFTKVDARSRPCIVPPPIVSRRSSNALETAKLRGGSLRGAPGAGRLGAALAARGERAPAAPLRECGRGAGAADLCTRCAARSSA